MKSNRIGKYLRLATIILVGLAAAMNILGGIGTSCAAFFTKSYPPMWSLLKFQWLYQLFVVVTFLIGVAGAWTTAKLARGGKSAYRNALTVLVAGVVVNLIHVIVSISLRGKATPGDVVLGLNVVALLVLVIAGMPGFRKQVAFDQEIRKAERAAVSGMAAIASGTIVLTVPIWAAPTHTFQGENWVYVLAAPVFLGGGSLLAYGLAKIARLVVDARAQASKPSSREAT